MKKTIFLKVLLVVAFSALLGSCGTINGLLGMIGLGNLFGGSDIVAAQTGDTKGSPNVAQTAPTQTAPTQDDPAVREVIISKEPATYSNFEVSQNPDNTVTIVKYNGLQTDVVIPEMLYNLPVTAIAQYAFQGGEHRRLNADHREVTVRGARLTSVVIPDTVTKIGHDSFTGNRLTRVTIGKGVRTIDFNAFEGNAGLTEIIIPDSVTEISRKAFSGCGLTSITLGRGLQTIGEEAFSGNRLTSVTLPAGLKKIGSYAFANNRLTSVTLPVGLEEIYDRAFYRNQIQSVTIHGGIRNSSPFFQRVFEGNTNITSITLPANVYDLSRWSFEASFISFYEGQNRAAGTYTKNGPIWARSTAGGID